MSTLKATNLSHASAASPNIVLDSAGKVTFGGAVAGAGLDLITPTSVAGTGVTVSGGAVSFSGSSTVSVNGCFTATYDNYMMEIAIDTVATAGNYFTLRVRAAGSDISTATYNFQTIQAGSTTISSSRATSQTSARLGYVEPSQSSVARVDVFNPARAVPTNFLSFNNEQVTAPYWHQIANVNTNATAYDGFSILSANAITGTVRIYGLRNS